MIIATILAVVVGLLAGGIIDALLRGRDPRSAAVIVWGVCGALAAAVVRYVVGPTDLLIVGLSAVVGGMMLSLMARARVSAQLERSQRAVEQLEQRDDTRPVIQTRAEVELALAKSR
jgi:hypothetical protein